ncbi:MAG: hypothetical protein PHI23_00325 [Candidatus Peribacteraceae bacterium]|nr:hypothetical protein [Candidatus Peribacteraceae bacterium]
MATPLGELLGQSLALFRKYFILLLVGAVVFGLVLGFGQQLLLGRMQREVDGTFQRMGIEVQDLQDLQRRYEQGDTSAMQDILKRVQEQSGLDEAAIGKNVAGIWMRSMQAAGGYSLFVLLVSVIASAYFLVIVLKQKTQYKALFTESLGVVLPLIGLWLWVAIRSFVWIPFIGFITGIILLPRFLCAPVFLVRDKKGVFESASMSYKSTRGYWGKIFGNAVVMGILVVVLLIIIAMALALFGTIGRLVSPIVTTLASAYMTIFMVQLALTVMQNPRKS